MSGHRVRFVHLWLLFVPTVVYAFMSRSVEHADDLWWSAKSGEWMLQHQQLLTSEIFVYTPVRDGIYYNPQWLAQIALYGMVAAGPAMLLFMRAIVFAFVFGTTMWHTMRRTNSPELGTGMGLLAFFVGRSNTLVRPQMLVFPLFVVWYFVLFGLPDRKDARQEEMPGDSYALTQRTAWHGFALGPWMPTLGAKAFLLPVTMVLWANTHGSFVLGIVLIACYVFATAMDHLGSPEGRIWLRGREARRQAMCFALTAAAMFVNPYGYHIFDYVHAVMSNQIVRQFNAEHAPPSIYEPTGQMFFLSVLIFVASVYASRRRFTLADVSLSVTFWFGALTAVRNAIWWGLVSAPIIGANVGASAWKPEVAEARQERRGLNYAGCVAMLACYVVFAPFWNSAFTADDHAVQFPEYPAGIARELEKRLDEGRLEGNLFNHMDWGGYLGYRLYPRKQLFIDGRFEARRDAVWEDYLRIARGDADWQMLLDKPEYGRIRFLILTPAHEPNLILQVRQSRQWKEVYRDGHGFVFERAEEG